MLGFIIDIAGKAVAIIEHVFPRIWINDLMEQMVPLIHIGPEGWPMLPLLRLFFPWL